MDAETPREAIEVSLSICTRRLSAAHDIPQILVLRRLLGHGKSHQCCREVSHELTEQQAQQCVKTCQKLMQNLREDRFIR